MFMLLIVCSEEIYEKNIQSHAESRKRKLIVKFFFVLTEFFLYFYLVKNNEFRRSGLQILSHFYDSIFSLKPENNNLKKNGNLWTWINEPGMLSIGSNEGTVWLRCHIYLNFECCLILIKFLRAFGVVFKRLGKKIYKIMCYVSITIRNYNTSTHTKFWR